MRDSSIKVLISSKSFGKTGTDAINILKNSGVKPVVNTTGRKLSENELIQMTSDAVGIIAGTEEISKNVILQSDTLKVISRYGVGIDNIDLDAAQQKGIKVYNTPGAPTEAVAELTLTLLLNLMRKIAITDNNIRKNIWKPEIGNQLKGKTIGILGLGKIGKRVVELFEPFNVKFLAFEEKPDEVFVKKHNIKLVNLDELVTNSEVISIHIPLTEKTRYIIGKKEISKMKNTAILINTARGGLVDEKSLYEALKNNKIAGAALDVFENEPYNGKLKELSNTILTPHIGSSTFETRKEMDIESVKNIINGLKEAGVL